MSSMHIQLEITTYMDFDGDYYSKDTMDKIADLVEDKIQSLSVLIQEGSTAPKKVQASIILKRITYDPHG